MRPLRFRGWSLSLRRGLYRTPCCRRCDMPKAHLVHHPLPGTEADPPRLPLHGWHEYVTPDHLSPKPPELEEEANATARYMQRRYGAPQPCPVDNYRPGGVLPCPGTFSGLRCTEYVGHDSWHRNGSIWWTDESYTTERDPRRPEMADPRPDPAAEAPTLRLWVLWTEDWDYDEAEAMAVLAPTETEARAIADDRAANPPRDPDGPVWPVRSESSVGSWLNPERTTCVEVSLTEATVVLAAVHYG